MEKSEIAGGLTNACVLDPFRGPAEKRAHSAAEESEEPADSFSSAGGAASDPGGGDRRSEDGGGEYAQYAQYSAEYYCGHCVWGLYGKGGLV